MLITVCLKLSVLENKSKNSSQTSSQSSIETSTGVSMQNHSIEIEESLMSESFEGVSNYHFKRSKKRKCSVKFCESADASYFTFPCLWKSGVRDEENIVRYCWFINALLFFVSYYLCM